MSLAHTQTRVQTRHRATFSIENFQLISNPLIQRGSATGKVKEQKISKCIRVDDEFMCIQSAKQGASQRCKFCKSGRKSSTILIKGYFSFLRVGNKFLKKLVDFTPSYIRRKYFKEETVSTWRGPQMFLKSYLQKFHFALHPNSRSEIHYSRSFVLKYFVNKYHTMVSFKKTYFLIAIE
jgi:hypothetical protein